MRKNPTGLTPPFARHFVTLLSISIFMAILLAIPTIGASQDDSTVTDPAPIVESGPELPPIEDTIVVEPAVVAPLADDPIENVEAEEEPLPFREQTIYIPYKDLRRTFEREGRGVFLPYEEFRRLWDAAREPEQIIEPEAPPVGALITETNNEANVSEEVVTVKAEATIELLALGWHTIPLGLADAAITEATIDGEPARLTQDPNGAGYQLLIENKDDGDEDDVSERITLKLTYAKAIQRSPGRNEVSFQAPRAAVSRWFVRIPESGVKVDFFPLIAATEESDEPEDPTTTEDAEETVVLAFVGSAPTVDIGWTPKAEGATGLEALATVQTEQQITIDEGVVRTRTLLEYKINRAELDRLAISIPADQRVLNVFDANVRGWSVNRGADEQTIDVQLFEPAKESQSIIIELEKFRDEEPSGEEVTEGPEEEVNPEANVEESTQEPTTDAPWIVEAPVVRAIGVSRQQGLVVVLVGEELSAEATLKTGLMQVDPEAPGELSESLRVRSWELGNRSWDFAYRYATVPFSLQLTTEKVQPRIESDTLVEVSLRAERITLDASTIFNIERAGVFQLQCEIPDGYEIRRVSGRTFADAQAVSVETHHTEPAEEGWQRLTVNLSRKAIGKVGLLISLDRRLDEPALLTPTGENVEVDVPLPIVTGPNVERTSGRTIIYAPQSLRVDSTLVEGLQVVAPQEAMENTQVYVTPRDVQIILAHLFGEERANMSFELERRKPHITFRQSLVAEVQDGLIEYRATFFYTILYSGVPSLRIDIPADIASTVRNDTPELREAVITEEDADNEATNDAGTVFDANGAVVPGETTEQEINAEETEEPPYIGWSFTGKSELIGEGQIVLSWEEPLAQLNIGGSVNVDVPRLVPQNADISSGEIVLAKAETIDLHIREETSGLEPIDAQHELTLEADATDGARAFRYHGPWNLAITAVRYELAEIRHTSVERALIRAVVHRSTDNSQNGMTVQALYRIKAAAGKQRLPISLPSGARITKSQINNAPILLETENAAEGSLYYVPLVGLDPQMPFVLEIQYSLSRNDEESGGGGHDSGQGDGDGSGPGNGSGGGSGTGGGAAKASDDGLRIEYPTFPAEPAVQEVYLGAYLPETWDVLNFDGPWTRRFDWTYDEFEGRYDPEPRISDYDLLTWIAEDTPVYDVSDWNNFPTDGRPVYLFSAIDPGEPSKDALQLTVVNRTILKSVTLIICAVLGLMLLAFKWIYRLGALVLIGLAGIAVYTFHPVLIMHIGQRTLLMGILIITVLWAATFIFKLLRKPEKLPSIRFNIRLWSDKSPMDWLSAKCRKNADAAGKPDETSPPPGDKPNDAEASEDVGDTPFASESDSPSTGSPPLKNEDDDSVETEIVDSDNNDDLSASSDDLPEGGSSDA
jgi:hypothetical protein